MLSLGKNGRLGNQLFQAAAVIGAARFHNVGYMLPEWPLSRRMAGFPFTALKRSEGWRTYAEPFFRYCEIPPPDDAGTSLWGYFQSWRYFAHCVHEIRTLFGPNAETLHRALAKLPDFSHAAYTGAIHVRRGDYQSADGYYFDLAASSYYAHAQQKADGFAGRWYLFTDDPEWCNDILRLPGVYIVSPDPEPYVDLVAMSLCESMILANSTFSWWAAMLNVNPRARIYCPEASDWFGKSVRHDTRDLLPQHWIRVPSAAPEPGCGATPPPRPTDSP